MADAPKGRAHRTERRALDAATLLQVEVILLSVIPARLVIKGTKGLGSPALILALLMFLAWVFTVLSPGMELARRSMPVRIVLLVFWVGVLLSYVGLNMHPVAGLELANADRTVRELLAFTGIVLTAAEGLRGREDVLKVLRAAVSGAAFMAFVGLLQFRPGIDLTTYIAKIPIFTVGGQLDSVLTRGGFNRPSGTALHPIEFGVIVGTALAFAIHLAIYDRATSTLRRLIPVALIGAAIAISGSRSALLIAAVVLIYFFAGTTGRLRRHGAVVVAGGTMFLFVAVPGMISSLKGLLTAGRSDSSITSRTSDYAAVASYLRRSPWIGRGVGTFLPTYRILDNQYLLSLIEIGIIGTLGLLAVFFLPAALGRMARRRSHTEADRNLGQMIAASGIGVILAAVTFDAISFGTFMLFVGFWVGISAAWWGVISGNGAIRPCEDQAIPHDQTSEANRA